MRKTTVRTIAMLGAFLTLLPLAGSATAQVLLRETGAWGFGPTERVLASGNCLYVGSGRNLVIYEISAKGEPVRKGQLQLGGFVAAMFKSGNMLFIANYENGLIAVDVLNPAKPFAAIDVPLPQANAVTANPAMSTVYVAAESNGLYAVDFSGANVVPGANILGNLPPAGMNIDLVGGASNYLYVADGMWGVDVVNASNGANLIRESTIHPPGGYTYTLSLDSSGYLYTAGENLSVYNVSTNPNSPQFQSTLTSNQLGGYPSQVVRCDSSGYSYVALGAGGLGQLSFSAANELSVSNHYPMPNQAYVTGLSPGPNTVWVASSNSGLWNFDPAANSASNQWRQIESFPGYTYGGAFSPGGNQAAVLDESANLYILDLNNPAAPYSSAVYPLGAGETSFFPPVGMQWDQSGTLYVANTQSGSVHVFGPGASPESPPVPAGAFSAGGALLDLFVVSGNQRAAPPGPRLAPEGGGGDSPPGKGGDEGGEDRLRSRRFAYLACGNDGLRIYDCTDPQAASLVGTANLGASARAVWVQGRYAYVAARNAGLFILDVSSPTAPQVLGNLNTPGSALGVTVKDSYAYVADQEGGLRIIRIDVPTAPVEVGSYQPSSWSFTQHVTVQDSLAYVSVSGQLHVVDVSDPAAPVLVARYSSPGYVQCASTVGGQVLVVDGSCGAAVVSTSMDPTGDVNADGVTDVVDLVVMLDVAAGRQTAYERPCLDPLRGDFNGNGQIDAEDCSTMFVLLAGNLFP